MYFHKSDLEQWWSSNDREKEQKKSQIEEYAAKVSVFLNLSAAKEANVSYLTD